jgi:maleylacetoacetate isomerase
MILYSNAFNSAGERVRIALALKNISYEYVSIQDIGWEEYGKINPQGLMPTLAVGDELLMQSTAICEYLEEQFPTPALLPDDPLTRAHARAFAQAIASEMHAIDVLRTRKFLKNDLAVNEPGIESWTNHWFEKGMQALEAFLALRRKDTIYCFSDEPGWAELFLVPQLRKSVGRYFLDISPYPRTRDAYERCLQHPAFMAAAPEHQSDYAKAIGNITIRGKNDNPQSFT